MVEDNINFSNLLELIDLLDGQGLVVTDQEQVETTMREWYENFIA